MAVGDIYKLQCRFDYGAVTLRNTLFYKQLKDPLTPGQLGATLLVDTFFLIGVNVGEGILTYFASFQNDQCLASCAIATTERPVSPSSLAEYQVKFRTTPQGQNPGNGLPPGSTAVVDVVMGGPDQGKKPARSKVYVGGLAEIYTDGVFFTPSAQAIHDLRIPNLVSPREQNEPDPQFIQQVRSGNPQIGYRYNDVSYLNFPCFPSVRRSRKPNPC